MIQEGMIQGNYLQNWGQAEVIWQRATQRAKEDVQHWEAVSKVATVAYYKKQYRQAAEALEKFLQEYPTIQTANFVKPYLWYIKNCTKKKI